MARWAIHPVHHPSGQRGARGSGGVDEQRRRGGQDVHVGIHDSCCDLRVPDLLRDVHQTPTFVVHTCTAHHVVMWRQRWWCVARGRMVIQVLCAGASAAPNVRNGCAQQACATGVRNGCAQRACAIGDRGHVTSAVVVVERRHQLDVHLCAHRAAEDSRLVLAGRRQDVPASCSASHQVTRQQRGQQWLQAAVATRRSAASRRSEHQVSEAQQRR